MRPAVFNIGLNVSALKLQPLVDGNACRYMLLLSWKAMIKKESSQYREE